MRKPKHGEIWTHANGNISLLMDTCVGGMMTKGTEFMIRSGITNGWNHTMIGWNRIADFDDKGKYVGVGTGPHAAGWDLQSLLWIVSADDDPAQAKAPGCSHEFVQSRTPSKGSRWCKACGEYAP